MTLFEIASVLGASCTTDFDLTGISIDSRKVEPGHLFIAIQGERLDGHDFIEQAIEQGAAAIVCHRALADSSVPQLLVPDTINALAQIAAHHRQQLTPDVIALTGSNGKTTVKEMIASILPKPSFATPGNLNNHIGAPLSVLQLQPAHRYAVFELGASGIGEIAHTVSIVKPNVTLINNIAPAHIGGFGSIDGVARAKGEIHQGLAEHGTAVVNDDDAYAHFWDTTLNGKQVIRFSAFHEADIYARDIQFQADGFAQFVLVTPIGETFIQLNVPGQHNVSNALAASACAYALNIPLADISAGLSQFSGVAGRMTFRAGIKESLIIDDTYNANLNSALSALNVLAKRKGRRIFVFGDMSELGDYSQQHHEEIGQAALKHGIDRVMTVGTRSVATSNAFGHGSTHYETQHALASDLINQLDETTTVLVKGSRSSAMENIVKQLVVG